MLWKLKDKDIYMYESLLQVHLALVLFFVFVLLFFLFLVF